MNFKEFKKKSASLTEAVQKMVETPTHKYQDERIWMLKKDSSGNASATIRFLPQRDLEKSPVFLTFYHSAQPEGRWFIEDCPHTIGEKCPICEYSSALWTSDEKTARAFWRKKGYIANILVVQDEANPENEGKVFLFKFGKSIYDMIMAAVAPEDEDDESLNVFDFDEGYDFKLKLTQKAGYNNYDKSKFAMKPSEIAGGDVKAQEEIFNSIHDLSEFGDPERFKSYDELAKKLASVTSGNVPAPQNLEKEIAKEIDKSQVKEQETEDDFEEEEEDFDFDKLLGDDSDDPDDIIPF